MNIILKYDIPVGAFIMQLIFLILSYYQEHRFCINNDIGMKLRILYN